jgi:CRP/FNR family transcriptional regulator
MFQNKKNPVYEYTMICPNRGCPFFESQAGGDLPVATECECIVGDAVQYVSFEQDEVLFLQGQPNSSLYSLTEGVVKICSHTADGQEQIVGLSNPGHLLLGLQSINEKHYAYTGVAATPVRACKINHKVLLARVEFRADVAMRLIKAVNAQLAHSRALMEAMGHKSAAAKIASFILLITPKTESGNCRFAMPFSRLEIASILGLSEETVCRLMANMKRSGAIYAPRGKVEIRDRGQLQALSEGYPGERRVH